ncbi:hypothetical protein K402DRAFT_393351 [Aulographum hederae CBS 113979]|uniref:Uncharacterized protein n=1 Tax=Aulographum hederae CBS 113979 TaxID=1176131 RepID=A0A6G1H0L7_9PEZI|nr:hypothetical protein K402DRAFT_393351 [Aulographum hederae CBS 113979]
MVVRTAEADTTKSADEQTENTTLNNASGVAKAAEGRSDFDIRQKMKVHNILDLAGDDGSARVSSRVDFVNSFASTGRIEEVAPKTTISLTSNGSPSSLIEPSKLASCPIPSSSGSGVLAIRTKPKVASDNKQNLIVQDISEALRLPNPPPAHHLTAFAAHPALAVCTKAASATVPVALKRRLANTPDPNHTLLERLKREHETRIFIKKEIAAERKRKEALKREYRAETARLRAMATARAKFTKSKNARSFAAAPYPITAPMDDDVPTSDEEEVVTDDDFTNEGVAARRAKIEKNATRLSKMGKAKVAAEREQVAKAIEDKMARKTERMLERARRNVTILPKKEVDEDLVMQYSKEPPL